MIVSLTFNIIIYTTHSSLSLISSSSKCSLWLLLERKNDKVILQVPTLNHLIWTFFGFPLEIYFKLFLSQFEISFNPYKISSFLHSSITFCNFQLIISICIFYTLYLFSSITLLYLKNNSFLTHYLFYLFLLFRVFYSISTNFLQLKFCWLHFLCYFSNNSLII